MHHCKMIIFHNMYKLIRSFMHPSRIQCFSKCIILYHIYIDVYVGVSTPMFMWGFPDRSNSSHLHALLGDAQ